MNRVVSEEVEDVETLTVRVLHADHQLLQNIQGHQLLLVVPDALLQEADSPQHLIGIHLMDAT